ncbi:MAG: hypothetical protein BIFFINMI_00120 [Phycisphaerae bacterium]|nr:hypothetical protein [Phycisphaerae bacterium]
MPAANPTAVPVNMNQGPPPGFHRPSSHQPSRMNTPTVAKNSMPSAA